VNGTFSREKCGRRRRARRYSIISESISAPGAVFGRKSELYPIDRAFFRNPGKAQVKNS
jgi:hypothetical protein